MRTLSLDIETRSSEDLAKSGVYRYAAAPDFAVLLFAYAFDDDPVSIIDLASGEELPAHIIDALEDRAVLKWAHNAAFERICLSQYLGHLLDPASWRCTMVLSATCGLPLSLAGAAEAVGMRISKMAQGKNLIRYFCKPPYRTFDEAPEKWETFKSYCIRDVVVEMELAYRLSKVEVLDEMWDDYAIDQAINDHGVRIDTDLVKAAMALDHEVTSKASARLVALTGIENPSSVIQIKAWLTEQGIEFTTLDKKAVAHIIATCEDPRVIEALQCRQTLSHSATKKYAAMDLCVNEDGRARGLFQFYGAGRTGRWAGRRVQLQNLKQNHLPDLELARSLVLEGRGDLLELFYESVPDVLSECVRTALIPTKVMKFIVADFSAIEARVIAWLAHEGWREEVFATHGKIYEASAAAMFKVPIEEVTKTSEYRQKAKIAELALGFGGAVGALEKMGALDMGLAHEELQVLVTTWRRANPAIVDFWYACEDAAIATVTDHLPRTLGALRFSHGAGMLNITLPSGRQLHYVRPRIAPGRFGKDSLTYEGLNAAHQWVRIETFGGRLVENVVQATARDLLMNSLRTLTDNRLRVVMHVHDEVVVEAVPQVPVEKVVGLMSKAPVWAEGLALRAEGYECSFYQKG